MTDKKKIEELKKVLFNEWDVMIEAKKNYEEKSSNSNTLSYNEKIWLASMKASSIIIHINLSGKDVCKSIREMETKENNVGGTYKTSSNYLIPFNSDTFNMESPNGIQFYKDLYYTGNGGLQIVLKQDVFNNPHNYFSKEMADKIESIMKA